MFWWTLAVSPGPESGLQYTWASVHHSGSSDGMLLLTSACIPDKQLACHKTEYLKCKLTIQGWLLRREKSFWEQILYGLRQNSRFLPSTQSLLSSQPIQARAQIPLITFRRESHSFCWDSISTVRPSPLASSTDCLSCKLKDNVFF